MATTDTTPPVSPFVLTNGSFKTSVAPQVTMVTTLGTVVFQLDSAKAPMTTANMLAYVNDGFYNGTLFHRVVAGTSYQIAQGGGYTTGLTYKTPTYSPIQLESNNGLSNLSGTIGMARTSSPNTATSQFYVNVVDNTGFNYVSETSPGYAVFGSVVSGMSVIQNMATQPTSTVGVYENVPQTEIVITLATETTVGISKSKTGIVSIGALESGATWEYSIDSGTTWKKGKGTSFTLAAGSYDEHTIQVRQTDAAGNVSTHVGVSDVTLVVDKTAPKMASFSPVDSATGVGVADNVVLTFNEAVVLGTGAITLKTAAGVVVQTFTVTPGTLSGAVWTLNPTNDLTYGTSYQIEITKGTFTDVAGNDYAGIKTYKFSTTDTITTSATSYTLGTEVNKLSYSGTAAFTGTGNAAANTITGGSGGDSLFGLGGNDVLIGGAGVDILYGGDGSDTVTGGDGNDFFVLSNATDMGTDLFVDFTQGQDRIGFITKNFTGLPATLTAADLLVGAGKTKPVAGQHLIYNTSNGALYYDADGLAATAAIKVAIVGKAIHPTLSVADFLMG
ncbi:MAG: hypothetical protein RIR18_608 [Pseudomonadota bacterium]|jgi:cyclophilin family peptidyl-prolyl cis-trans isomerase